MIEAHGGPAANGPIADRPLLGAEGKKLPVHYPGRMAELGGGNEWRTLRCPTHGVCKQRSK